MSSVLVLVDGRAEDVGIGHVRERPVSGLEYVEEGRDEDIAVEGTNTIIYVRERERERIWIVLGCSSLMQ